ncbi:MAG: adenine phosphoribosyltransferase [Cyclobacteriaceae bacterium]
MITEKVKSVIIDVPDFPRAGIVFKDITPILGKPDLICEIVEHIKKQLGQSNISGIACIESRGFWLGTILAYEMQLPIIPIRKKGKLPSETISISYDLEYGSAEIEVQKTAVKQGDRILIHDDLLATGGTAEAAARLMQKSGAMVSGFSFLVDLTFLKGADRLRKYSDQIMSIVEY